MSRNDLTVRLLFIAWDKKVEKMSKRHVFRGFHNVWAWRNSRERLVQLHFSTSKYRKWPIHLSHMRLKGFECLIQATQFVAQPGETRIVFLWIRYFVKMRALSLLILLIYTFIAYSRNFPVACTGKNLLAMQETWVQSVGREVPLEKGMATPSSILALRIPLDRGA